MTFSLITRLIRTLFDVSLWCPSMTCPLGVPVWCVPLVSQYAMPLSRKMFCSERADENDVKSVHKWRSLTRVKHRRKGGVTKIKHVSHYFATVSGYKIVLIRNLQVTRGYENKLIVALIWASLNQWKNQRFRFTRHYWSWLNEIEHCLGRHF